MQVNSPWKIERLENRPAVQGAAAKKSKSNLLSDSICDVSQVSVVEEEKKDGRLCKSPRQVDSSWMESAISQHDEDYSID